MFYIGCAVWSYRGWVGEFLPPGTSSGAMLEAYGERMTAVEGNTTFYAVPSGEQVARWASRMPRGFKFCPKLHRDITHDGALVPRLGLAERFRKRMQGFGEHLGPFHLQLPPSYHPGMFRDLARFLESWPIEELPLGVELRHRGWYQGRAHDEVTALLGDLGAGWIMLDTRPIYACDDDPQALNERKKPELPLIAERTARWAMLRYIGHPDRGRNTDYLETWATTLAQWLAEGTTVYAFAHCPIEDHSPFLARKLYRALEARDAKLAGLPWDNCEPIPQQVSLL